MDRKKYEALLLALYKKHGHDDGTNLDAAKKIEVPEELNHIVFTDKCQLREFDPNTEEYWKQGLLELNGVAGLSLPPDPMSDEEFYELRRKIGHPHDIQELSEQSILRCCVPETEIEIYADDVSSEGDWEDFFEGPFVEVSDQSEGDDDHVEGEDDEDVRDHERPTIEESIRNIALDDSISSESGDDSEQEECDKTVIQKYAFRPSLSSTFCAFKDTDASSIDSDTTPEFLAAEQATIIRRSLSAMREKEEGEKRRSSKAEDKNAKPRKSNVKKEHSANLSLFDEVRRKLKKKNLI